MERGKKPGWKKVQTNFQIFPKTSSSRAELQKTQTCPPFPQNECPANCHHHLLDLRNLKTKTLQTLEYKNRCGVSGRVKGERKKIRINRNANIVHLHYFHFKLNRIVSGHFDNNHFLFAA
jgi:hypothetical protein